MEKEAQSLRSKKHFYLFQRNFKHEIFNYFKGTKRNLLLVEEVVIEVVIDSQSGERDKDLTYLDLQVLELVEEVQMLQVDLQAPDLSEKILHV